MKVGTRPVGSDVVLAICCALAVLSIVIDRQLSARDVVSTVLFSVGTGVWGTIAVLKYNGVIQERQASPDEVRDRKRKQIAVLLGLVLATVAVILWHTLKVR